jgi:sugar (pentulose or hexulose) kinase
VGTPVICGTIDAAAEAFSVGVLSAGDMMVMYGSTIFIILLTENGCAMRGFGMRHGSFPASMLRCRGLRHPAR